jgi:hypothetical protein
VRATDCGRAAALSRRGVLRTGVAPAGAGLGRGLGGVPHALPDGSCNLPPDGFGVISGVRSPFPWVFEGDRPRGGAVGPKTITVPWTTPVHGLWAERASSAMHFEFHGAAVLHAPPARSGPATWAQLGARLLFARKRGASRDVSV